MKHNLVNFTRGSQLLGHFGFMFAAGLKGPLIVTLLVVLGLVYWDVSSASNATVMKMFWRTGSVAGVLRSASVARCQASKMQSQTTILALTLRSSACFLIHSAIRGVT